MHQAEQVRAKEGEKVDISGILHYLSLSRSGYYLYKERLENHQGTTSKKEMIKQKIREIYLDSKEIYGAPKIRQELLKAGHKIAEKTVGNYMREMGIKACYVKPYTITTTNPDFDHRLKNLLEEQYNPKEPNTIWCSDITYISTEQGFCYLTSIMDLFSRRIISWRLSTTLEAKWVVLCIEEAKAKRRGAKPLIMHSDRGSQYVSTAYLKALDSIKASYSMKASPWQNACIESFHALLKREWLYRFKISSYKQAKILVFEYIEAFYNTVRSHSHCNYMSPLQFEEAYQQKLNELEKNVA